MNFPTEYQAILQRIQETKPVDYCKSRNYLDGAVTRLSPYISRGVISTKQVFDHVMHLRLDERPRSLGTLAAQVGGLDSVRQFFSSSVVFALVDLPFTLFFITVETARIFNNNSNYFCPPILPRIPSWNFDQSLGTAKNNVGLTLAMLSAKLSSDSTNDMLNHP